MNKPLRHLCVMTGRIKPYGIKPITFPKRLVINANIPSCFLYIQNLLISTNGTRLYRYIRSSAVTRPYSSKRTENKQEQYIKKKKSTLNMPDFTFCTVFQFFPYPASDQNIRLSFQQSASTDNHQHTCSNTGNKCNNPYCNTACARTLIVLYIFSFTAKPPHIDDRLILPDQPNYFAPYWL